MILESILSCSYLFLTCGSCMYTLIKHSYHRYSKLLSHFVYACCGIATISTRSFVVLIYKLFFKEYALDPATMEVEEERSKGKYNTLYELLDTLSMATLIYSLSCHHGCYTVGACIVTSLSILDVYVLYGMTDIKPEIIITSQFPYVPSPLKPTAEPRCTIFIWVLVSICFAFSVGNDYALVANYPYVLTNWALPPEGFYQGWTIRRTIHDYLMAAYTICMTEALRQT